jgi:tol-pal system protein YbgF
MSGHLDGVNKSVASVVKTLESISQKFTARFDEQDRRIDSLGRSLEQVNQKSGSRPQNPKQVQRPTVPSSTEAPAIERHAQDSESPSSSYQAQQASSEEGEGAVAPVTTIPAPVEAPVVAAASSVDIAADRGQYERVLALFRDGDLEGARRGFSTFIANYPNSDLAPNARYWLGEAYYGAKDFKRAIDAYDKVESDYPRSEKVPAAILKKGYAYLALKDKKRASSAFKQVVTLYPRSPEAGKASDKLVQLKEGR